MPTAHLPSIGNVLSRANVRLSTCSTALAAQVAKNSELPSSTNASIHRTLKLGSEDSVGESTSYDLNRVRAVGLEP